MNLAFERVSDASCRLGESPVYDDRRDALFFCDIPERRLYCLRLTDMAVTNWLFDSEVGSLGLCQSGRVVVALRDRVVLFDPQSEAVTPVADVEADRPDTRLNDGKVGPDGAFWVGSIDDTPERRPIGTVYRVTAGGTVEAKIGGLRTTNGLAFSPDGRLMYHADSRGPWVDRWAFEARSGAISDRRRFADFDEARDGRPDGGATDAEGCYWSAGLGAGRLNRFGPDGTLIGRYPVPVPNPTMPCFAGSDLRTLFVTSLRRPEEDRVGSPLAGGLFRARSPVAGAPVARFRDG